MTLDKQIGEQPNFSKAIFEAAKIFGDNDIEFWKDTKGNYVHKRTQAEFAELTKKGASSFLDLGLQEGRNGVIIPTFMECNPDYLVLESAINAAGFIAGSIYTDDYDENIVYKMKDMDAEAIIVDTQRINHKPSTLDKILDVEQSLPNLKYIIHVGEIDRKQSAAHAKLIPAEKILKGSPERESEIMQIVNALQRDDPLKVVYTSGTSGNPKGAMLSNQNYLETIKAITDVLQDIDERFRTAAFLPHAHIFGSVVYHSLLLVGAKQFYTNKAFLKRDVRKIKPNLFVAVPKVWENYIKNTKSIPVIGSQLYSEGGIGQQKARSFVLKKAGLDEAVYVVSGAAYHPKGMLQDLEKFFGRPINLGYGPSESTAAVSVNLNNIPFSKDGHPSIGKPFPHLSLRVVDEEGNPVQEGEIGTLVVDSDKANFMGYLNQDEATKEATRFDGVTVDDAAFVEGGDYFVIGRQGDTKKGPDAEWHHLPTMAERLKVGGDGKYKKYVNVVVADFVKGKPVAIVALDYNPEVNSSLLAKAGVKDNSEERFYDNHILQRVSDEVQSTLQEIHSDSTIPSAEKFNHVLYIRPPSFKNDLTPTLKVKEGLIKTKCMPGLEYLIDHDLSFAAYNPETKKIIDLR